MAKSKYDKYFLTDIKMPSESAEADAEYAKFATRMTRLDGSIIEGAFQFGLSWYYKSPHKPLPAHTHDFPEILGFYGSTRTIRATWEVKSSSGWKTKSTS